VSELLDQLAREAARPITRSQALKLVGGAMVTAAVPAALRPGSALASRRRGVGTKGGCEDPCRGGPGIRCMNPGCPRIQVCCPQEQPVCCKAPQQVTCCWPGQTCKPANVGGAQIVVCQGCPTGQEKCGTSPQPSATGPIDYCCAPGRPCADASKNICCDGPGQVPCAGAPEDKPCCDPGDFCCNGKCCSPPLRCHRGRCKRCPRGTRGCGNQCCEKKNGESCCNGRCCKKSQKCCFDDHCCGKKEKCCGEKCCGEKEKCCGEKCCGEDESCCKGGCCEKGTTCASREGTIVCCRNNRVLSRPGRDICCPSGDVATGDRCCPAARPNCGKCNPACGPGTYCRDGACIQV
jgi:hypothetical protein